jgi:hypothetical protein
MRNYDRANVRVGSRLGPGAVSAQCPDYRKADMAGRFMSTRLQHPLRLVWAHADSYRLAVASTNQSPCSGGSASLLIEVLRWRNACGRRDTVAALTGAGVVLINNDRPGRGIGPGGVRTQRVEACFLLVAKPVVEFRECGLYAHHRTVRCFEPLLHGLDPARRRDCRIDRAICLKPFCRRGGYIFQFVQRRALR